MVPGVEVVDGGGWEEVAGAELKGSAGFLIVKRGVGKVRGKGEGGGRGGSGS